MIDLHCHILPGVDDGAKTLGDSLAMAKVAMTQGITDILCTPHYNNGVYNTAAETVYEQVAQLQTIFEEQKIPLQLHPGQEIRIGIDLVHQIQEKKLLFADSHSKYLLLELPTQDVPAYTKPVLAELIAQGYQPVIVHPERNSVFIEDPNRLRPFLEMGVMTQMTAPSYVGIFGKRIERTAHFMMKHNFIHMMASDAHNTGRRTFYLKEGFQKMTRQFGAEKVRLMEDTARAVLAGETVTLSPALVSQKKFFHLFTRK